MHLRQHAGLFKKIEPSATYKIVTMRAEHSEEVARLFAQAFCNGEPLTQHLKISESEFYSFAKSVADKSAHENLSVVALNHEGKVVACSLSEDICDIFKLDLNVDSKLIPIIEFMEQLARHYLHDKLFERGKVAHMWVTAVDDKYKGEKLAIRMNMAAIDHLKLQNYLYAYAEFTNRVNEGLVFHPGRPTERCVDISYSSFSDTNHRHFKGLTGGAASYVLAIDPEKDLSGIRNCYTPLHLNKPYRAKL